MEKLVSKVNGLKEDESIYVMYKGLEYWINCYIIHSDGTKKFAMGITNEYGIHKSMNIEKMTNNFITMYSFDMFGKRITARIKVADITIKD